jgi:hypothetical protein
MSTEGARMARLVADARCCDAAQALARARRLGGQKGPCATSGPCRGDLIGGVVLKPDVPVASVLLEKKMDACAETAYLNPFQTVPESIRIQTVDAQTQSEFLRINPRAEFNRFFPPACPPAVYQTSVYYDSSGNVAGRPSLGTNINTNPAIPQLRTCPPPNRADQPSLPG